MFDHMVETGRGGRGGSETAAPISRVPVPVHVESSERARQREIAAYLSAASFPSGLPTEFPAKVTLNPDPTLNALCQLGVHRLGGDRAFLSFIDREHQFVVAEITKSNSLRELRSDANDHVFLGVCKLDVCVGVCPTTMKAFMDETGEWVRTGPDVVANRTRYIIHNFQTHPDYMDRPYVAGYPHFTSYIEVPLISPLGYILGSYCVIHNKVHDFDNDYTVGIMNEVAAVIMAHLENVRIKQNRDRSELLIQGLSGFIRQEPHAHSPSKVKAKVKARTDAAQTTGDGKGLSCAQMVELAGSVTSSEQRGNDSNASSEQHRNDAIASSSSNPGDSGSSGRLRPPVQNPGLSSSSEDSSRSQSSDAVGGMRTPPEAADETPPTTPSNELADNPFDRQMMAHYAAIDPDGGVGAGADADITPPTRSAPEPRTTEPSGFISSANIKSTFFRAAATIRRSMDLDGLMFLDAVPSAYEDRSDQPSLDDHRYLSSDDTTGPFCAAIVQSAVGPAGETIMQSSQTRLPEVSLQRFIRAFPQGHVFTADEFGPIDETYGPGKPFPGGDMAERDQLRIRKDIAALFLVLPAGAKYVVFLPLWHFQRECWYAAALGWVEDPTRAIDVADIGLVSAFGNSVMAEVSRLEALAASRAKSDFVSSLSHELRSPLHGIMASSELLRDHISEDSSVTTLDMLDSCATTLLDTFNNLLDHAIVTHDVGRTSRASMITASEVTDLGALVEDVMEAVRVGHLSGNAFHMQSSTLGKSVYSFGLVNHGTDMPDRPLLITLNVAARSTWKLPINIGAWKRIVMNIFGNALKYTSFGRIEVSLRTVQRTDKSGTLCDYVSLLVQDTGLGMSSDYLKYHLFTPFSQENSHSPGVGLGLSIVQQLVKGIGGVVSVKSSVGVGTQVEVAVPLNNALPDSTPIVQEHRLKEREQLRSFLTGQTVCLVTPEAYTSLTKTDFNVTRDMRHRSAAMERALKTNAGDALGMNVSTATKDSPIPQADLYVVDGVLLAGGKDGDLASIMSMLQSHISPLVLLCSGSGAPACSKHEVLKTHHIHLHHPVGPRKLASVFASALKTGMHTAVQGLEDGLAPLSPVSRLDEPAPAVQPPPTSPIPKDEDQTLSRHPEQRPLAVFHSQTLPSTPSNQSSESALPATTTPDMVATTTSTPTLDPPPPPPTPKKTHHLLLVDDNPINIKLLTTVVHKQSHTLSTASNGLEAVQLYQKSLLSSPGTKRFDLVFMDISMPVMNGFEATRLIRQLESENGVSPRCQIVALTGLSGEVSRNEAAASGCDLFLTKPVKMDRVRALLREMGS